MFRGIADEFSKFIARGNVIDMAVGIIMGSAFTGIVNSLVQGIFMPVFSFLISGVNFSDWKLVLKPAVGEAAEVAISYGTLVQQTINFLIISLVVFAVVKILNKLQSKFTPAQQDNPEQESPVQESPVQESPVQETPAEPVLSDEVVLLSEIRDLLKTTSKN